MKPQKGEPNGEYMPYEVEEGMTYEKRFTRGAGEGACFACGSGPGSADLHIVSLDERSLRTCFREHCQETALAALREPQRAGLEDFLVRASIPSRGEDA